MLNSNDNDTLVKTNFFQTETEEIKLPKEIFTYKNLKVFYPVEPDDVQLMYKLFSDEFYNFLVP